MQFAKYSLAAATGLLIVISVSSAQAACSQQFSHTTCSGWGPMQKCTNHFKTVCTAAPAKPIATIAPPKMVAPPASALISNTSGGIVAGNTSRVVGGNGASIVGNNTSRLIQDGGAYMRPR